VRCVWPHDDFSRSPCASLDVAPGGASIRTDTQDGYEVVCLRSRDALEATFAPQVGMTCCSLRHRGVELIGERYGLEAYASCGITMGMSLMHPWANRLSSWKYTACGATVRLPASPLLHADRWGLPLNGVQSCGHAWVLEDRGAAIECAWLDAMLPFDCDPRQLALFPFPHRLHVRAEVTGCCLCISTEIQATGSVPVPVCLGYRVYVRREQGRGAATIVLPARRRVVTDARRLTIESLTGFPLARVRTVASEPHVLVEALTAAPYALSRDLFPVATPERPYLAVLRLSVDELSFDRSRLTA
jgi:galactose mutarotase-like enzyme